jgi:hypothetical protein
MNILLLNVFGTLCVITVRQPGALSHRLAALRDWASQRNSPSPQ